MQSNVKSLDKFSHKEPHLEKSKSLSDASVLANAKRYKRAGIVAEVERSLLVEPALRDEFGRPREISFVPVDAPAMDTELYAA